MKLRCTNALSGLDERENNAISRLHQKLLGLQTENEGSTPKMS
jgi:hypothetical protein